MIVERHRYPLEHRNKARTLTAEAFRGKEGALQSPTDGRLTADIVARHHFRRFDLTAEKVIRRAIFYVGGDSYPADRHWETAIRNEAAGEGSLFVSHPEIHKIAADAPNPLSVEARVALLAEAIERIESDRGGDRRIFLIGRSSGARAVSVFASRFDVTAVVCLNYPFKAPQHVLEPERFVHLASLQTPTLIVQGKDDVYGGIELTENYQLSDAVRLRFVPGGHEQDTGSPAGRRIIRAVKDFIDGGWLDSSDSLKIFDETFYLGLYPDVAKAVAAGVIPSGRDHFHRFGRRERRRFRLLDAEE